MVFHETIRELLGDRYNLILPTQQEAIYSDLMGLKLICINGSNIVNLNDRIPA